MSGRGHTTDCQVEWVTVVPCRRAPHGPCLLDGTLDLSGQQLDTLLTPLTSPGRGRAGRGESERQAGQTDRDGLLSCLSG